MVCEKYKQQAKMNIGALFLNFYVAKMAKLRPFHVMIIIHKYLATCENDSWHSSNMKTGVLISQKTVFRSCKFPDVLVDSGPFKSEDIFSDELLEMVNLEVILVVPHWRYSILKYCSLLLVLSPQCGHRKLWETLFSWPELEFRVTEMFSPIFLHTPKFVLLPGLFQDVYYLRSLPGVGMHGNTVSPILQMALWVWPNPLKGLWQQEEL